MSTIPDALERTPPPRWAIYAAAAVLLFVVVAVWAGRARLTPMPLERDEGEYAYMGQLLLQGVPPYQQAYNMKLPGTSVAYAIIMSVFGQTQTGIHLGLIVVNAVAAGFVFLIGRRLIGLMGGLLSAACYLVVTFTGAIQGTSANAEHFVLLFALPGLWLMQRTLESGKPWSLVVSGLLLGTGVLMKQHGGAFVLAGGFVLLVHEVRQRPSHWPRSVLRLGLFGVAAMAPFLLTCLGLAAAGVFGEFKFWVFDYARTYGSHITLKMAQQNFSTSFGLIFRATPLLWLVPLLGLVALGVDRPVRRHALFMGTLLILSCLAVFPGLFFRPHYFMYVTPILSLLFGTAAVSLFRVSHRLYPIEVKMAAGVAIGVAVSALALSVWQLSTLWYVTSPRAAIRTVFAGNPFCEALEFGDYIREHSEPDARVAVIGSEPQLPFYAQRRSATAYIYMYPLMEHQPDAERMQRDAAAQIEAAEPEYLIYCLNLLSWLPNPESPTYIFEWLESYVVNYEVVGVAVMRINPQTELFDPSAYSWGDEAHSKALRIWQRQEEVFSLQRPPAMILFKRLP